MPRRNKPGAGRSSGAQDDGGWTGVGHASVAHTFRGPYLVRTVPGQQAVKSYRCPHCQQEIRPGTSHVVAWPQNMVDDGWSATGISERRHWHSGCWQRQLA